MHKNMENVNICELPEYTNKHVPAKNERMNVPAIKRNMCERADCLKTKPNHKPKKGRWGREKKEKHVCKKCAVAHDYIAIIRCLRAVIIRP